MGKKYGSLLFAFLVAIGSISCTSNNPEPVTCAEIMPATIALFPIQTVTFSEAVAWAKESFPKAEVTATESQSSISWGVEKQAYNIWLEPPFRRLSITNPLPQATVSQVISCFGPPGYYEAVLITLPGEQRNERLTIWYPDKGYKFEVRNYGGNVSGEFSEKSLVNSAIVLTPPGTIDEMARYIAGDSVSVLYEGLAPWIETSSTSGIKIQAPEWTPD